VFLGNSLHHFELENRRWQQENELLAVGSDRNQAASGHAVRLKIFFDYRCQILVVRALATVDDLSVVTDDVDARQDCCLVAIEKTTIV